VLEWNEMYSIGESHGQGGLLSKEYPNLPPGHYQMRIGEETVMGRPVGPEATLSIFIPPPYWELPWFWAVVAACTVAGVASAARYVSWHRVRGAMSRLDQQRMLELERVRIAQDIHDDLGARVTQISLVSGLAENDGTFSKKARDEFHRISFMSRDLVSALYETVWAVNPENDNLRAVGNYLCQMVNELCTPAQLRCRLHVPPLPRQTGVSSRIRHNLSMAAKEAVHNVLKHARASQVTVRITFEARVLTVSIQDDGCGFQPGAVPHGNGLSNMKRRLEGIGGSCLVESAPDKGTTVFLRLTLESNDRTPPGPPAASEPEPSPPQN
jgi:signal transduction histidine kinase